MTPDIEEMLRQLPLRPPGQELDARVLRQLRAARRRWQRIILLAAGTAAAAGIAAAAWAFYGGDKAPPAPPLVAASQPTAAEGDSVRCEQRRSALVYQGTFKIDDGLPVRVFRRVTLNDVWCVDEQSDLMVHAGAPQEELVLVRAAAY